MFLLRSCSHFIMNYNCCHRQEDWQQSPAELSPISLHIYLYIITLFNKLQIFKVLIVITDIYIIIIIVIDKIVTNLDKSYYSCYFTKQKDTNVVKLKDKLQIFIAVLLRHKYLHCKRIMTIIRNSLTTFCCDYHNITYILTIAEPNTTFWLLYNTFSLLIHS